MNKFYTLIYIFIIGVSTTAKSQLIWGLDQSFNNSGKLIHDYGFIDNITNVKIQPADQKIIAVGTALNQAFSGRLLVMRILPNGTLDNTFNDSGSVVISDFTESYAYDCFVKSDGKIVVVGAAANEQYEFSMLLLRLNADGTRDSTFGVNGITITEFNQRDEYANAAIELPDQTFLIAGTVADSNYNNVPTIVKFKEDGSIESLFGNNGIVQILPVISIDNDLNSIVIQPDNKILVSGHFDQGLTSGGAANFDLLLARINPNGTFDASFGNNGVVITSVSSQNIDESFGMKLTNTNEILLGGFSVRPDGGTDATVLKYKINGAIETSFGTNGKVIINISLQDVAYDLEILPNQKIILAGSSGDLFGTGLVDFMLVKLKSSGERDSTFGENGVLLPSISSGIDEANAMAIQSDGKIVLGGKASNGTNNDAAIARFSEVDYTSISKINNDAEFDIFPNPINSTQNLYIQINKTFKEPNSINIYSAEGKKVFETKTTFQKEINELKLPNSLQNGMYLIEIISEDGIKRVKRLIVNN
jgi:uncharacterized delta-60 repeat protein